MLETGYRQVGAADPELKNSPIMDEGDEDAMVLKQEVPGEPLCHFNSQSFQHGDNVLSGSSVLSCNYGVWIRQAASSDPDNP